MAYLFSDKRKTFLTEITKSEKELNKYISDNWSQLFPRLIYIRSEFQLRGVVRGKDGTGWVDILAFNPSTNHFVVVELKKDKDKNIRIQASDYRDYIEDNFERIYLRSIEDYNAKLPKSSVIDRSDVEIILIAKEYYKRDLKEIDRKEHHITFVKYNWFKANSEYLLYYEYLNNKPLADLQPIQKKVVKEGTAKYGKGKDVDAVKILGGGELMKNIRGTKFYKLSRGEIVAIKYSKQYSDHSYWYGITPTTLNKYKEEKISHMVFILHKEGVVKLPIRVLKDYLKKAANITLEKDGSVGHYHIFIKGNPEYKLYTSKERKMWDIKDYCIQY